MIKITGRGGVIGVREFNVEKESGTAEETEMYNCEALNAFSDKKKGAWKRMKGNKLIVTPGL